MLWKAVILSTSDSTKVSATYCIKYITRYFQPLSLNMALPGKFFDKSLVLIAPIKCKKSNDMINSTQILKQSSNLETTKGDTELTFLLTEMD